VSIEIQRDRLCLDQMDRVNLPLRESQPDVIGVMTLPSRAARSDDV
jgi:hypothetical protein